LNALIISNGDLCGQRGSSRCAGSIRLSRGRGLQLDDRALNPEPYEPAFGITAFKHQVGSLRSHDLGIFPCCFMMRLAARQMSMSGVIADTL